MVYTPKQKIDAPLGHPALSEASCYDLDSLMVLSEAMANREALIIRVGEERDYAAIASIYNQAIAAGGITFHEQQVSADEIRGWVTCDGQRPVGDHRESLLVLVCREQVLGWGIIKRYSDRSGYRFCCETSIYLDRAEQGKGYGSILQTALLEKVAELGYHHVVLKIVASNQSSICFHQKFGFELVGIQKEIGFTQGCWQDVAIMQLVLPSTKPNE